MHKALDRKCDGTALSLVLTHLVGSGMTGLQKPHMGSLKLTTINNEDNKKPVLLLYTITPSNGQSST